MENQIRHGLVLKNPENTGYSGSEGILKNPGNTIHFWTLRKSGYCTPDTTGVTNIVERFHTVASIIVEGM